MISPCFSVPRWCLLKWPTKSSLILQCWPCQRYKTSQMGLLQDAGNVFPPPTSRETASLRARHASRHMRHARDLMHVGIANLRWRGKRSRHSRRMCNRQLYVFSKRPIQEWFYAAQHTRYKKCYLTPGAISRFFGPWGLMASTSELGRKFLGLWPFDFCPLRETRDSWYATLICFGYEYTQVP